MDGSRGSVTAPPEVVVRRPGPRTAVVVPHVEVDVATGPAFRRALEEAAATADVVVVDLTGVTFFSAAGLQALLTVHGGRGALRLAGVVPGGLVAKILRMSGIGQVVPSFESLADALAGAEAPEPDPTALVEEFSGLVTGGSGADPVEALLQRVLVATTGLVPGADSVRVAVTWGGRSWDLRTPARTSAPAQRVLDLDLRLDGADGWLTLDRAAPGDLDPADVDRAVLLAALTSTALSALFGREAAAEREEQLRKAMDTRDVIGQAKGILMARRGIGAEAAFEVLRTESQNRNAKLVELARTVATTGELGP